MRRVIRIESSNIETKDKRQKKLDSLAQSNQKKEDDRSYLVVPAGYLKPDKK